MPAGKKKAGIRKGSAAVAHPAAGWLPWVLILAGIAPFLHVLPYEFLYDDQLQILRNPWIRSWEHLGDFFTKDVWAFMETSSNYYRPLHMFFHHLGYQASGNEPHAYHGVSILLHALSTMLVGLIGLRLTGNRGVALAGGLLFALHPMHAESVAWIAAVTDPSCAVFYFAALYFYLRDQEQGRGRLLVGLSLACFLLALFSKEMAFTFPLVALLADRLLLGKLRVSRYLMLAGVFGLYALMRVHALSYFMHGEESFRIELPARLWSTVAVLGEYVLKLFVPHDINPFHVFRPAAGPLASEFLAGVAVLALAGAAAWLFRHNSSGLFLLGFILLTLLPVLNITGLGENVFADRYLYIPSLGAALILPVAARSVWECWGRRIPLSGTLAGMVLMVPILLLWGFQLLRATPIWRDELTFYRQTIQRSPDAIQIWTMLGRYHHNRRELDEAERCYRRALELWETDFVRNRRNLVTIESGLGSIRLQQNRYEEARDHYTRALQRAPGSFEVIGNLAAVYLMMNDLERSMEYNRKALELNPRSEVSYSNMAYIRLLQGRYDDALLMAQRALDIYPGHGEAYLIMGRAYASKGLFDRARQAIEAARRVDPSKEADAEAELKALESFKP